MPLRAGRHAPRPGGFTLVELLVALAVMALLALMGWRGIDALARTQQAVQARMDQVAVLQTGLAQWQADLDALASVPFMPPLEFDGRVLRLVRQDASTEGEPLRVVAWGLRSVPQVHGGRGSWVRWQSPPVRDAQGLLTAWNQAQLWGMRPTPGQSEAAVVGLDGWQLFFFRGNAWSNALSDAGTPAAAPGSLPEAATPDGVRLVLELAPGQVIGGSLTRDWMRASASASRP